jgi:hypothetical protein
MVGDTVAHFIKEPQLTATLSAEAQAFVDSCYQDLSEEDLFDYHTHLFGPGKGCCESGCMIPPEDDRDLKMQTVSTVFMKCAGVKSLETGDEDFVKMLRRLVHGKHILLAFDKHYKEDGSCDLKATTLHTPNSWVEKICNDFPDVFIPSISVHPYRKDALEELEKGFRRGVKLIKWLPNSMGIDPLHALCIPFFEKVKEYDMVILSHAGEERAVESHPEAQELGNPLRMRRALNMGC